MISQELVLVESKGFLPQKNTTALIALGVLYFMLGFITCLNDTLVPYFKRSFTLSYTESSFVQFYFFLTYGLFSIPAGKLIERTGYQRGMVIGFTIAAFGSFLFVPAAIFHMYYLFLIALFIIAIGIVFMQVSANPYIVMLGSPKTASARLNLIQSVGSIGTIVAPVFGASFILVNDQPSGSSQSVIGPYLAIAAMLVVICVVVYRLHLPQFVAGKHDNVEHIDDTRERKTVFSFRNLNLGTIGIFFMVGIEVAIASFLTNYISDVLDISDSDANRYVAFYWAGMLIGRLIGVLFLNYVRPTKMLIANSCISIFLILFSINTQGNVAVWSLIAVGLFNSVLFAIIFSLSISGLGKFTTRGSAILSTAISGGAVIVVVQGMLVDSSAWTTSFFTPIICYLYIIFYGINGYKSKYSKYN